MSVGAQAAVGGSCLQCCKRLGHWVALCVLLAQADKVEQLLVDLNLNLHHCAFLIRSSWPSGRGSRQQLYSSTGVLGQATIACAPPLPPPPQPPPTTTQPLPMAALRTAAHAAAGKDTDKQLLLVPAHHRLLLLVSALHACAQQPSAQAMYRMGICQRLLMVHRSVRHGVKSRGGGGGAVQLQLQLTAKAGQVQLMWL